MHNVHDEFVSGGLVSLHQNKKYQWVLDVTDSGGEFIQSGVFESWDVCRATIETALYTLCGNSFTTGAVSTGLFNFDRAAGKASIRNL